jgi:hypothetical protein
MLGFVITFYNFGMFSTSNKLTQLSFSLLSFLLQPMDEMQVRVLFMMGCLMTFHIMDDIFNYPIHSHLCHLNSYLGDENFKKTCFFFL